MLIRRKAPGPVLRKSRVVGLLCPKHDSMGVQCSIGCSSSTATGAAHFAELIGEVRALAVAPTSTELIPKTREKKPGTGFWACTRIVSPGWTVVSKETPLDATPPSFLSPYSRARPIACAGW